MDKARPLRDKCAQGMVNVCRLQPKCQDKVLCEVQRFAESASRRSHWRLLTCLSTCLAREVDEGPSLACRAWWDGCWTLRVLVHSAKHQLNQRRSMEIREITTWVFPGQHGRGILRVWPSYDLDWAPYKLKRKRSTPNYLEVSTVQSWIQSSRGLSNIRGLGWPWVSYASEITAQGHAAQLCFMIIIEFAKYYFRFLVCVFF